MKGVFQSRRPGQRLARTLESIHDRGQDTSCPKEKLSVKVQHTQKPLLLQGRTSRSRDEVAKKRDLGDSKLTLGEAYFETMLPTETEDLLEVVKVRGKISTEDEDVIHILKTER